MREDARVARRVRATFRWASAVMALGATILIGPAGAQAALRAHGVTSTWEPLVMPASPAYWNPSNTIAFAADSLGNIYYLPVGSCQTGGFTAGPHARAVSLGGYVSGCGIMRYNPTTGSLTQLDGGHNFSYAQDVAVDPVGNVFVLGSSGTIYEISPSGVQTTFSSAYENVGGSSLAGGIAVNAQDQVFVTFGNYASRTSTLVQEVATAGATPVTIASVGDLLGSIAVAPDGTLYATSSQGANLVYRIPAGGGTPVSIGSGWTNPATVAVDAQGNAYVADDVSQVVTELTTTGQQANLPGIPVPGGVANSYPTQTFWGDGMLYVWDSGGAPNTLYEYPTGGAARLLVSAVASAVAEGHHETQSVTATWTGSGYQSYECTLLYGFNDPTAFSERSTSTSCTFTNLELGVSWGVQVVGFVDSTPSAPSVAFAPPAPVTITCVRGQRHLHRTGPRPVCPTGWRVVGSGG